MSGDIMTREEVHAHLRDVYELLTVLYGRLPVDTAPDTAFAIGEAAGVLSKAKALVGRDIDHAKSAEP